MTMRITRRELVQRGAAGVTILSLPGLLAACGGSSSGGSGSGEVADVLRFSNWPLYIDYDEKTKMSRSIPRPCDSGPWTFAKYDALSLMSSK